MRNNESHNHTLIMENRNQLRVSGVKDIDSFTDTRIILNTVMGELVIKGQDLHVTALEAETGDFSMTGTVKGLFYNSFSSGDNFFGRLFR